METHNPGESTPNRPAILSGGKKAGVGMHFSSLCGPYGIGDIGDSALAFVDSLNRMKIGAWQFLPTGPTTYGDSPYQPLSAFAGNEMLIGIEPLIRLGLVKSSEAKGLAGLPWAWVDYGKLIPRKQALLNRAARRFMAGASAELRARYEYFLSMHENRWLGDYGAYRILKTRHGERPWTEWDSAFVQREPAAMKGLIENHGKEIEYVKIIQFLFDEQWQTLKHYANEHSVSLFGDMPIYIALDSADAWSHPDLLLIDEDGSPSHVSGVPPDYFSADGQLWGNPLYDWQFHKDTGYRWWIERVQHAARQSDLVRIDHFRGFESFWAVRSGAETAREGEWLPGPADDLFNALREALGNLPIVAEDLGVITPQVVSLRQRHEIPGMKVLQFLVDDPDFSTADIKRDCICYTGTHDNDTTVGWFRGGQNDTRTGTEITTTRENAIRMTGGTAGTIHLDMIRFAFNSDAILAIAPLQDFLGLGSEARLNTPGTTSNNWRWRVSAEQLSSEFCKSVAEMVTETSRNH
jgi:4-alpha-glucanotransferase